MDNGIKLGKLFGIDISLGYSWFFIFALITLGLAFALFPQMSPGLNTSVYIAMGVITSLLFFASVLLHELVHSLVAKSYGINVEGIRLMIFGGVSQLTEEPRTPRVEFWMAFAGPLTSLVLGGIFLGAFFASRQFGLGPFIVVPAFWLGYINILLGVFNLLPGFPLDGGRVLRAIVWHFTGSLKRSTAVAAGLGKGLSYTMMLVGVLGPLFGNFTLLWFILIGWYLLRASEAGYRQVVFEEAIQGIKVDQAMTMNPETVNPDINIEDAVKDYFMKHRWIIYPVVENDNVEGVISINKLKDVPRRSWKRKRVRDVMEPLSTDIVTSPDSEISDIMPKLNSKKTEGRVLVMKDDHLLGILTRADILRTIRRRLQREQQRPAA